MRVLVTGGTGSFGSTMVRRLLAQDVGEVRVLSRDELKQSELRRDMDDERLRYLIGDVRDLPRLARAMRGVDIVVHAAALKQVPACEYNPFEAIQTNIMGAKNVIDVALQRQVQRVIAISTDKAVKPVNAMGMTKALQERIFLSYHRNESPTKFMCVRYGNVVGSRGSVIPYFLAQRPKGLLTITDPRMTRFLITLDQGVKYVLRSIETMLGGEIFVPKIPSVRIVDLARVIAPECKQETIGIRPGEKMHEVMVPEDDAHLTIEFEDEYIIQPSHSFWNRKDFLAGREGKKCRDGFRYSSDTNVWWLGDSEISKLVAMVQSQPDMDLMPKASEPKFIVGG